MAVYLKVGDKVRINGDGQEWRIVAERLKTGGVTPRHPQGDQWVEYQLEAKLPGADPRRGSGRTTSQLERLVRHIRGYQCRAFYVVGGAGAADMVVELLLKHFKVGEHPWYCEGHAFSYRNSVLFVVAVEDEPAGISIPSDVIDIDHAVWESTSLAFNEGIACWLEWHHKGQS